MTRSPIVRVAWIAAVGFFVGLGAWAFLSARSFFDTLVAFPPYNEHLMHDIGAFQIGVGAALAAAATRKDGLLVALDGAAVAAVLHAISHALDSDIGGNPTDVPLLGVFAIMMVAGAVARSKEVARG